MKLVYRDIGRVDVAGIDVCGVKVARIEISGVQIASVDVRSKKVTSEQISRVDVGGVKRVVRYERGEQVGNIGIADDRDRRRVSSESILKLIPRNILVRSGAGQQEQVASVRCAYVRELADLDYDCCSLSRTKRYEQSEQQRDQWWK